jgi:hypothetical protein
MTYIIVEGKAFAEGIIHFFATETTCTHMAGPLKERLVQRTAVRK